MSPVPTDLLDRPWVAQPVSYVPDVEAIALSVSAHLRARPVSAPVCGETRALELIEASICDATAGDSVVVSVSECAQAVVFNGSGRYDAARVTAERASSRVDIGHLAWALSELVEASIRSGQLGAGARALRCLEERTRGDDADWALGILARSRALLAGGEDAEPLYREAIERFARSGLVVHLARAELIYGEWLRRENRRVDRASSCARRRTDSSISGCKASPSARAASWRRRARPSAGARSRPATTSLRRKRRSRGSPATGTRTPRSARCCSSARAPSNGTFGKCSRSSA